ncbi:MAG: hypothetical protein WBL44_06180 [Nitrososphaeraceae archaeon]
MRDGAGFIIQSATNYDCKLPKEAGTSLTLPANRTFVSAIQALGGVL